MNTSAIPIISCRRGVARYFSETLPNDIPLEMVLISAGSFMMGAPENELNSNEDERPQHEVTLKEFRGQIPNYTITRTFGSPD